MTQMTFHGLCYSLCVQSLWEKGFLVAYLEIKHTDTDKEWKCKAEEGMPLSSSVAYILVLTQ